MLPGFGWALGLLSQPLQLVLGPPRRAVEPKSFFGLLVLEIRRLGVHFGRSVVIILQGTSKSDYHPSPSKNLAWT